jgi:UDP-N-acetylglucosamine 2-epimerase (non-hydrolysing)
VFGTRPEAIKMAPIVKRLQAETDFFDSVVCVTGQHREMLDQVLATFEIEPDLDLDLMEENQRLPVLTARVLNALSGAIEKLHPDLVLVQGDTTTAMVAGLASFYVRIPVGHVEAGLRTYARYSPFPEEMNRRMVGVLADTHFAPTARAAKALREEGVPDADIFVTGNTVIDALHWVMARPPSAEVSTFLASIGLSGAQAGAEGCKVILLTAHRRENFGAPLARICEAVRTLVDRHPHVRVVYPVHPNPAVVQMVRTRLAGHPRIALVPPLAYDTFVHLMSRAYFVLTDSGGLQEEAPALGKPVLVLRDETERPEAVEVGSAKVVGTETSSIVEASERLLCDAVLYAGMAVAATPYGSGRAAQLIVDIIRRRAGRPAVHDPQTSPAGS